MGHSQARSGRTALAVRKARDRTGRVQIGSFHVRTRGIARFDLTDPYYLALSLSGWQFVLAMTGLYLGLNIGFGLLYALVPGCIENAMSVSDAFFFSIETLATVGFGRMVPVTTYGHVVASAEIFTGTGFTAVLTGLVFVRFSRPKPRIVYAARPVVTMHNGTRALMVRLGNGRPTMLSRASAQMTALIAEVTAEGQNFRRPADLALLRDRMAVFPITWTLIHVLDETSPLHGVSSSMLVKSDIRLFITIVASDTVSAVEISDLKSYRPDEWAFGMRYSDVISVDANGETTADMDKLSDIEPDAVGFEGG